MIVFHVSEAKVSQMCDVAVRRLATMEAFKDHLDPNKPHSLLSDKKVLEAYVAEHARQLVMLGADYATRHAQRFINLVGNEDGILVPSLAQDKVQDVLKGLGGNVSYDPRPFFLEGFSFQGTVINFWLVAQVVGGDFE